ncbi:MAG: hypothetical protein ACKN9T_03785 [Candidatus Methylumidiphilus sp.]
MTNWHCIRLTRQEYAAGELDILRGAFRAAYLSRNGPRGMALYGAWSEDATAYLVYATPPTERYFRAVLDAYSATPESQPLQRLAFICGDEEGNAVLLG